MSYATVMALLELGRPNAKFLNVVGDFAERFGSDVIGISACQPAMISFGDGYVPGEFVQQDREIVTEDFKRAEAEFRAILHPRVKSLEWRSSLMVGSLADYFATEARSADILILKATDSEGDAARTINAGDVIMQSGRPVLVVPDTADTLRIERVLIAWKDTRETRRAVLDAVPLLMKATSVVVLQIAARDLQKEADAQVKDVVAWLLRRGVAASAFARIAEGESAGQLSGVMQELSTDVVVAGAYGHSRLREWALGGVTRSLLLRAERLTLLSH
jgi:nucleotide-binding universal stress UspA family protein